jgi:hypothetical protein
MQASRMITHRLGFSFFHGTIPLFRPPSKDLSMRDIMALATRTVENKAFAFIFLSGRGFERNLATLSLSRFSRGTVRLFSYQAVFCTRLLAFTLPMPVAMSQPGVAPSAG